MKIVHLALSGPFTKSYAYHENTLPIIQSNRGDKLYIVARNQEYSNGVVKSTPVGIEKIDNDITLFRVNVVQKRINSLTNPNKKNVFDILNSVNPDVLWTHSMMNSSLSICVEYKKRHPSTVVCVDNHIDSNNYSFSLLRKINLFLFKIRNKILSKYIDLFYGVTPGRVEFMKKYLGAPTSTKLTIMGSNDSEINFRDRSAIRSKIRNKFDIPSNSFVYVTGGKLDGGKKIIELINTFKTMNNKNCYLVIFGSISSDIKAEFFKVLSENSRIIFCWISDI